MCFSMWKDFRQVFCQQRYVRGHNHHHHSCYPSSIGLVKQISFIVSNFALSVQYFSYSSRDFWGRYLYGTCEWSNWTNYIMSVFFILFCFVLLVWISFLKTTYQEYWACWCKWYCSSCWRRIDKAMPIGRPAQPGASWSQAHCSSTSWGTSSGTRNRRRSSRGCLRILEKKRYLYLSTV